MGNKLGHGSDSVESASHVAGAERPPRGPSSHVTSNLKKGGKAGNIEAQDDTIDEAVAEVPPPMEPIIAPGIPVNDKLGLSLDSPKPNNSCDSSEVVPSSSNNVITADSAEKAIQERSYRLQELLDSERVYVCDLEHCCQYIQYMRESKEKEDHEIPMPEDLRDGKDRMIFGNIEAIYEWHRE